MGYPLSQGVPYLSLGAHIAPPELPHVVRLSCVLSTPVPHFLSPHQDFEAVFFEGGNEDEDDDDDDNSDDDVDVDDELEIGLYDARLSARRLTIRKCCLHRVALLYCANKFYFSDSLPMKPVTCTYSLLSW